MPRALPSLRGTLKLALGQASCALLGDGTVRCWGPNQHGEVGDASLEPRTAPVAVCGLREAIDVGAGAQTCAAVRSGRVYCWGYRIPMAR
jgi:alpha-tubulin suppressor-like RCC1 family protein